MASTDDPKGLFDEVKRLLSRKGMASLSELERTIGHEALLKDYTNIMKEDQLEKYGEMLYVLERKQWVENGFRKEGIHTKRVRV